jgi:hypothetical protein
MSQNAKGNAPTKASFRKVLRSALANKGVADELIDAITGLMASYDALLAKLDLDTGVADEDYASTLSVADVSIDPDAER